MHLAIDELSSTTCLISPACPPPSPPHPCPLQVRAYFEAKPIYLLAGLVGLLCLPLSLLILRSAGKGAQVRCRRVRWQACQGGMRLG